MLGAVLSSVRPLSSGSMLEGERDSRRGSFDSLAFGSLAQDDAGGLTPARSLRMTREG